MSYYHDHRHVAPISDHFKPGASPKRYGSVVGTVEKSTERPIQGRSGDHLQFYVVIGNDTRYQVDVNTQSEDGTAIGVYIAVEDLAPTGVNHDEPLGAPAYGVFPDAQLSYQKIGLKDGNFDAVPFTRIDNHLTSSLNDAEFVSIYGQIFDDGGATGKGIHETHYTGRPNQDGAIAVYSLDATTNKPTRTWFFFKFRQDDIGKPEGR